jgi:hypothetical protein
LNERLKEEYPVIIPEGFFAEEEKPEAEKKEEEKKKIKKKAGKNR